MHRKKSYCTWVQWIFLTNKSLPKTLIGHHQNLEHFLKFGSLKTLALKSEGRSQLEETFIKPVSINNLYIDYVRNYYNSIRKSNNSI